MNAISDINKAVGERIRYYRKARGLTIVELANRMHISKSAVSKYERGQVAITLEQMANIAKVLEIDPYLLLDDRFAARDQTIFQGAHSSVSESFTKYYMYGYTGHEKAYPSKHFLLLGKSICCLYGEIESEENYRNCKYYYTGELRNNAAFQRAFLTNPLNQDDLIILEKTNPLSNKELQFAFGVSLSIGENYPLAFKWLLSTKIVRNPEKLKDLLVLSASDIRHMRKINAFSVAFKDSRLDYSCPSFI